MIFGTTRANKITLENRISIYGIALDVLHSGVAKDGYHWRIEAIARDGDGEVHSAVSLELDPQQLVYFEVNPA